MMKYWYCPDITAERLTVGTIENNQHIIKKWIPKPYIHEEHPANLNIVQESLFFDTQEKTFRFYDSGTTITPERLSVSSCLSSALALWGQ